MKKFILTSILSVLVVMSNISISNGQGDCKVRFCNCCNDSTGYKIFDIWGNYQGEFYTKIPGEPIGCTQSGLFNAYSGATYYVEEQTPYCDAVMRVYFTACVCGPDDSMTVTLPCCVNKDNNFNKNSLDKRVIPNEFILGQNYPNPFNPITQITFVVPVESQVKITVYDINGKLVDTPLNTVVPAGRHELVWNANNLSVASGVYFYKMEAGSFLEEKKMVLIK